MTSSRWPAATAVQFTPTLIGSGEMDVEGLRDDMAAEPVMRSGEWAFEI